MVDEDTKDLISAIQAYKTGKPVQVYMKETDTWKDLTEEPNWTSDNKYRAKPSVSYHPFNSIEECWQEMQKHKPFGWVKIQDIYYSINEVDIINKVLYIGTYYYTLECAYNDITFADGSKFGIEDNDLEVKIIETYSVQIRKLSAVLPLVKTVKDALHISLKEAKDIVDKARTTNGRIDNLSKEAAEKMAANINYWKGEAIIIAKEQSL